MDQERYLRQLILPQIGEAGQNKIHKAHIAVIGAGGLGCPLLLYLCAAGIGQVTIIDNDDVAKSNLHRQILFSEGDIGQNKASIAAERLNRIYPDCHVEAIQKRLDTYVAQDIADKADIVIDGSDSFLTKYIVSDILRRKKKPMVIGAVVGFNGYVAAFDHLKASYKDIFPSPPKQAPNCNEAGVLGPVAGHIATIMATETLKIISGCKDTLLGKIYNISMLDYHSHVTHFDTYQTSEKEVFLKPVTFITNLRDDFDIIDIREEAEIVVAPMRCQDKANYHHLPLSSIHTHLECLNDFSKPLIVCQSGRRAENLALKIILTKDVQFNDVFVLEGGLNKVNLF
ncbi:MAG: HesA/MoeB/ThiF family protein [Pseudomonadota bacterium]